MDRFINTALVLISVIVWMVKKYGTIPLLTGHLAKHAGVGRAKWTIFWNTPVRDHRQLALNATELITKLRAERERLASIALGNAHAQYAIDYDRYFGLPA